MVAREEGDRRSARTTNATGRILLGCQRRACWYKPTEVPDVGHRAGCVREYSRPDVWAAASRKLVIVRAPPVSDPTTAASLCDAAGRQYVIIFWL